MCVMWCCGSVIIILLFRRIKLIIMILCDDDEQQHSNNNSSNYAPQLQNPGATATLVNHLSRTYALNTKDID